MSKNIPKDISLTFFVLKTLNACGINEAVVQTAAKKPIKLSKYIHLKLLK
jgi:hypothetical protein